jgi:hypothetical protein
MKLPRSTSFGEAKADAEGVGDGVGDGVGVGVGVAAGPPVNGPQRSFEPVPTRIAIGPAADAVRMAVSLAAGTASDVAILPVDVDLWVGAAHRVEPGAAHVPLVIVLG